MIGADWGKLEGPAKEFLVKTVELKIKEFGILRHLAPHVTVESRSDHLRHCVEDGLNRLDIVLRLRPPTRELLHYAKPRDWWEAFKDRWFPAWALKRWPVIKDTLVVDELHDIPVPKNLGAHIKVMSYNNTPIPPNLTEEREAIERWQMNNRDPRFWPTL